jgi:uncharacterized protein YbjT (DUF2867 family)
MILVAGATGDLGGRIAGLLLDASAPVRVLVRTPEAARAWTRRGAEARQGDLSEPASLDAACAGVSVVVTTANSAARGGKDTPRSVDLEGNRSLIDAAKRAGVGRFVFVSALIADPESPDPFLRAKGRTELYLRESGLQHSILAPDMFMEVWLQMVVGGPALRGEPVVLVGEGARKHSFISAGDVARIAAEIALDTGSAVPSYLPLGGPQALSWTEAVAICERVLRRSLRVERVAPGEPVGALPPFVAGVMAALEGFDTVVDGSEIARGYGFRLTTAEEYFRGLPGATHDPLTAVPG